MARLSIFALLMLTSCDAFLLNHVTTLKQRPPPSLKVPPSSTKPSTTNNLITTLLSAETSTPAPPASPPLSYSKFLTLQSKRVVLTIRYTSGFGLRKFFLTTAKVVKEHNSDVLVEKVILPGGEGISAKPIFEVLVDDKLVLGKGRLGDVCESTVENDFMVYLPISEIDASIARARRRRRQYPNNIYDKREFV